MDCSLAEAFFNEYKAISIRSYEKDPAFQTIDLFANGEVTSENL